MDTNDIQWLCNYLHADIQQSHTKTFFSVYTQAADDYPAYTLQVREDDLQYLIRVLKDHTRHEHLQKTYPGIREAWMNYIMTVHMTHDDITQQD